MPLVVKSTGIPAVTGIPGYPFPAYFLSISDRDFLEPLQSSKVKKQSVVESSDSGIWKKTDFFPQMHFGYACSVY